MQRSAFENAVYWLTAAIRSRKASFNVKVRRAAECFTVVRERFRTEKEPVWQAVESNVSGYDVLSCLARDRPDPLQIEVKGSQMRSKDAFFSVTRNEWVTAQNSANYEFQLWLLHERLRLFVVKSGTVAPHLPVNQGGGRWEIAQLWFRDFVDHEVPIDESVRRACESERSTLFAETTSVPS